MLPWKNCVLAGAIIFLFSDQVFAEVSGNSGNSTTRQKARISKDPVGECLANKSVPENRKAYVTYQSNYMCKKRTRQASKRFSDRVSYSLVKANNQIQIKMAVFFDYKGAPKNREKVLSRVHRAKICVEKFYKRFGLTLSLDFKIASGGIDPVGWTELATSNAVINLWDTTKRSNSENYGILNDCGYPVSEDSVCSLMAHELGHTLGLPDTYADSDCPSRTGITAPSNIMNSGGFGSVASFHLNTEQVSRMIAPLCDR